MEIVFMMTGNLFHKFQKEGQIFVMDITKLRKFFYENVNIKLFGFLTPPCTQQGTSVGHGPWLH